MTASARTNTSRPACPCEGVSRAVRFEPPGFTLVELLIVVTVIAALSAVAVPRYQASLAQYRAEAAARRLAGDLERARETALATSSARKVTLDASQSSYTLSDTAPLKGASSDTVVNLQRDPYYARIAAVSASWKHGMQFDGHGAPSDAGSVEVSAGDEMRRVNVDAGTGRVWIERVTR